MAHVCLEGGSQLQNFLQLGAFTCEILLWEGFEGYEMAHVCLEGGSQLRKFSQLEA